MRIKSILKKNDNFIRMYRELEYFYFKHLLTDKQLIKKRFLKSLGRNVELENPVMFNDKLQWLKLYWYDPLASKCADKYEVREFIKHRVGDQYLNELYAVYNSVDEIDIEKLPNSFVLKATHGSGDNIICKDKSKIDWDDAYGIMQKWLNKNMYWRTREWVYKDIKPRIIAEKYIEQEEDSELRDYRFFCFNGVPKFISVDLSITNKRKTRRNIYDLEWKLMDVEISYPKELSIEIKRPSKLNEMIELSKIISEGFPHARIDFFQINDQIIFGEVTFFHQSGMGIFRPTEFEEKVGRWLSLPGEIAK